MDAREWFSAMTGRRVTAVEIAEILNITRKTVQTRLAEGLPADDLITVSRAIGINPVDALTELRKLKHGEVVSYLENDGRLLEEATDKEIVAELAKRIDDNDPVWDQMSGGPMEAAREESTTSDISDNSEIPSAHESVKAARQRLEEQNKPGQVG